VLLLLHAVRDDDVRVRRAAVAAVAGRTEALTALSAALADPDRDVRLAALAGLAQIDDERALDSMVFAASDPDSDVRDHALEALVANASFGLARRLAAGLSERNVHSIGAALVRMGEAGRRALTAVVSAGPPERAAAAASLLKGHDFAEGLSSVDPGVRGRAVDALAHLATADAVERLIGALSDPSPVVRARAVTRLSELGDQRGLEAVRRMLASEQDPRVIEAAQH
jgi:HEAT repeat protein